jgi:soluble lytic murein transglycosylase-like protein
VIGPPPPSAPLPQTPVALVRALETTTAELHVAIAGWNKSAPPPRDVTLLALYVQRAVRLLAQDPRLARPVLRLDPSIRDEVTAVSELGRLSAAAPGRPRRLRLGPAAPAARLLGWYRAAQGRFGVRWQLLAAINFVESAFGKVRNASSAGAQGPMQFEPATWRAYGLGGKISDPHDAIFGAANYLAANGASTDERNALYHYNPSALYVDAVLRYARQITRDPDAFSTYYSWQVYFRTPTGVRRVTGPR